MKLKIIIIPAIILVLSNFGFAQDLKFSDTQTLDKKLAEIKDGASIFPEIKWGNIINLPAYPNSKLEASFLEILQKKLTAKRIERIKDQVNITSLNFETKIQEKPATKQLCDILQHELIVAVLGQKLKFNRVRPSFVNVNVKPVVKIPGNPAYPSAHATQSHLLAYTMASLNPSKSKTYLALAQDITVNREYAGLNYRSDSYVGDILSKFMIRQLVQNEKFQVAFLQAAQEWGTKEEALKKLKTFLAYSVVKPRANKK